MTEEEQEEFNVWEEEEEARLLEGEEARRLEEEERQREEENSYFLRQHDIINQRFLGRIGCTVVGCGAIGSFSALCLAKMGIGRLVLVDNDTIEDHNLSNQFFTLDDLGYNKAETIKEVCLSINRDIDLYSSPYRFVSGSIIDTELVLASVDNIETRQAIFVSALESHKCQLYIDPRMLRDDLKVFTVYMKNPKEVLEFSDNFLVDVKNQVAPCTAQTIIYNVLMSASLICNIVKKYVNGEHDLLSSHLAYNLRSHIQICDMRKG